jgi:hypothetical protein
MILSALVLRSDVVEDVAMLLDGFHHVAVLTGSTERFVRFLPQRCSAEGPRQPGCAVGRLTFVRIAPHTEFNLFEVEGNTQAERQTPMFGAVASTTSACRRIDRELRGDSAAPARPGAADDFVTDFGPVLSMFSVIPTAGVRGLRGQPGCGTRRQQPRWHATRCALPGRGVIPYQEPPPVPLTPGFRR